MSLYVAAAIAAAASGACALAGPESSTRSPVPEKIDINALSPGQRAYTFVLPSPTEILAVLDEAPMDVAPVGWESPRYESLPRWRRSLALGVAVTDLVVILWGEDHPGPIVARLDAVIKGMIAVGDTEHDVELLQDLREGFAEGHLSKRDLVSEFDRLRVEVIARSDGSSASSEEDFALVAIGAWARAVHLVASHSREGAEVPEGADRLKLRIVVAALIDQLGTGAEVEPLVGILKRIVPLTSLGSHAEQATREDLDALLGETKLILELAREGGAS